MTAQQIAEICRQRLNVPNSSLNARFLWLIPQALNNLARKVAASERRRQLLMTDAALVTVATDVDGVADLSAIIASDRILIEFLHYGTITAPESLYPLQPVQTATAGFYEHSLAEEYLHYYLKGTKLQTINFPSVGAPLNSTLSFAVPFVPVLSALPTELEDDLIAKVCELATLPHNDYAEDSEH